MTIAFFSSPKCLLHDMGEVHPECPSRLRAINDQLIASGVEFVVRQHDATPINPSDLYRVHDKEYVDSILQKDLGEFETQRVWLDDDTLMMEGTLEAALYSAGAGKDAIDVVMSGSSQQAFCAVRPPGHHAERDKAMGFCVFNNIAVAAAHAIEEYGLTRIAIVDFDVHHGNGTEHIVAGNPNIKFFSSFQHPYYPFSGEPASAENIYNSPLPAGAGGAEFRDAVSTWLPIIDDFEPEMILISAGFDAHLEDDLAQMKLVESDYHWVTTELKALAQKHCEGRIVSMLEGGYALSALGRSVVSHINALIA
jgi:acetoin utilization deacetylase AcuC-like enzyme